MVRQVASASRARVLAGTVSALIALAWLPAGVANANETLGTPLPAALQSTLTQGGAPNFADTFVTPYVATQAGTITTWKTEFSGGMFPAQDGYVGGPGVPAEVRLKVLRAVSGTVLQVVDEGVAHDPRPILQARFGASYPFFATQDSVVQFSESGLDVLPGDLIGITIKSDPTIGAYYYPLVGPSGTRIVLRDVGVGGTIDLADIYTGTLPYPPALEINAVSSPVCEWSRIRPPVNQVDSASQDGVSAYRFGSRGVIPAKFQLTCNGDLVDTQAEADAVGPVTLALSAVLEGGVPVDYFEEALVTGSANTGALFRFDDSSDQFIYNISVKDKPRGAFRIRIQGAGDTQDEYFLIV